MVAARRIPRGAYDRGYTMGYTREYNRHAAGRAWEILGYTHSGAVYCPDCADSRYPRARIMGQDEAVWDNPAPVFACDDNDSALHCGLCGAVVLQGR
jgi:hypothetical protein